MTELKAIRIPLVDKHPECYSHLKVRLYYHLGGYNYGTHENEPRGYYLSCYPVHYASKNGYTTESYSAFSGIKVLVSKTTRNTKKQIEKVIGECSLDKLNDKDSWFFKVCDYTCRKHNLHITECALKKEEIIYG